MAKVKVGINGLGRIGRTVLREIFDRNLQDQIEVVLANDLTDEKTMSHLLRFDSVHGTFGKEVMLDGTGIKVDSQHIELSKIKEPANIPWEDHGVEVVLDCTGIFRTGPQLQEHIKGSVKKVILSAPGKDIDGTFVMGVNDDQYDASKHHIISNASCTTNCLAPVCKILNDKFKIKSGVMTTIHSYTGDQRILDAPHKDLRRARAAAVSMIPTTTGAAAAVGIVIPELNGLLDGYAVRVPTANVSMVDFSFSLEKSPSVNEINEAFLEAEKSSLKGILEVTKDELVSCDFNGNRFSSIFDSFLTKKVGDTYKVISWYDNEVGYSNRMIDLLLKISQ